MSCVTCRKTFYFFIALLILTAIGNMGTSVYVTVEVKPFTNNYFKFTLLYAIVVILFSAIAALSLSSENSFIIFMFAIFLVLGVGAQSCLMVFAPKLFDFEKTKNSVLEDLKEWDGKELNPKGTIKQLFNMQTEYHCCAFDGCDFYQKHFKKVPVSCCLQKKANLTGFKIDREDVVIHNHKKFSFDISCSTNPTKLNSYCSQGCSEFIREDELIATRFFFGNMAALLPTQVILLVHIIVLYPRMRATQKKMEKEIRRLSSHRKIIWEVDQNDEVESREQLTHRGSHYGFQHIPVNEEFVIQTVKHQIKKNIRESNHRLAALGSQYKYSVPEWVNASTPQTGVPSVAIWSPPMQKSRSRSEMSSTVDAEDSPNIPGIKVKVKRRKVNTGSLVSQSTDISDGPYTGPRILYRDPILAEAHRSHAVDSNRRLNTNRLPEDDSNRRLTPTRQPSVPTLDYMPPRRSFLEVSRRDDLRMQPHPTYSSKRLIR